MSIPYWPGDTNPATFQSLDYNPSTNTLTLTPFGNSVSISPITEYISSINASTISTTNLFANVTNSSTINSYITNSQTTNTSTINSLVTNTNTVNTSSIITSTITTGNANISSINGQPLYNSPVVNYIDPYGSGFVVSTLGTLTPVSVFNISTIPGHTYLVNVEYGASNTGGGGANDLTALAITNNNNLGQPYGKTVFLDSWSVSQTYDNRYNSACGFFTTLANSGGSANISVSNLVATGNTQSISIIGISAKDMGEPQNAF